MQVLRQPSQRVPRRLPAQRTGLRRGEGVDVILLDILGPDSSVRRPVCRRPRLPQPVTGAAAATAARWYAQRHQQPEGRRHPEVVCTVEGRHYFDQQAVESFWAAWQQDVGTGRLGAAGRRRGDGLGANRGGPGREQRERA
ncbi:hypothetical protein, partial [Streptomyces sp. NRRL S-813]|uniref:hypothetical protein n=1 Tax=Streptomyces sp. NRRL S-813 TaxID=1463919 RepID=UPI0019012F91